MLELALDSIFGDVGMPEAGRDRPADVIALMSGRRRAMLRHSWSAAILGRRPVLDPNVPARTDFLYATPATRGLACTRFATAAYAVANCVIRSPLMRVGTSGAADHLAWSRLYPPSPRTAIWTAVTGMPRSSRV